MRSLVLALVAACILCPSIICADPPPDTIRSVKATAQGVAVDAGSLGSFELSYPGLIGAGDQVVHKILQVDAAGAGATVKYEGGGQAAVEIQGHDVTYAFTGVPGDVTKLRVESLVSFSFADGGKWQIDGGAEKAFPVDKQPKPFLYQGNGTSFTLKNFEGKQITFTWAEPCYQQLQDNREWNWKTFDWFLLATYHADWPKHTLTISAGVPEGGPKRVIVVDRFGQDARADFPGKVKTEGELKADVTADKALYDSMAGLKRDEFGGLLDSGRNYGLKTTGFFHVEKNDKRWLLVDPAGNAFFDLGICCFQPSDDYTYLKGREGIYEWIPAYDSEFKTAFHPVPWWSHDTISFYVANVIRKYGKPYDKDEWAARMIDRVRKWGFNAGGSFSSPTKAHQAANFPYTSTLPLYLDRQVPGLKGIFDPFDPANPPKMDELFAKGVTPSANDPLLIGYYLSNEQPFEDIPRVVPSLKADSAAKQRLVSMLKEKYATVDAFNTAWGMKAASLDALADQGLPVTTKAAAADMTAYTELFLDAYYSTVAAAFRKADPHHMLIGSRWQPGTANSEPLLRIAGKYLDVVSVNYYTTAFDPDFLARLEKWSGDRPMLLSEWHYCSTSDTGLPGGSPEVKDQKERGLAYRTYVEQAASTGYVVGMEWFTLIDQARTGRYFEKYGGENANTGLFAVTDRGWLPFLKECLTTNTDIYDLEFGKRKPFVLDDPRFKVDSHAAKRTVAAPRAVGPIVLDGQRNGWPGIPPEQITGKRLVMGADAGGLDATFRLCWDDTNLYFMANVTDATPMKNSHSGDTIWNGDAIELFIGGENLDQAGPLIFSDRQILLSGGKPGGKCQSYVANAPAQPGISMEVIPSVDGTGYTLEAAIPLDALSLKPHPGQQLLFDVAVDDSPDGQNRVRQLMWSGGEKNSSDRSHWGLARFGQ